MLSKKEILVFEFRHSFYQKRKFLLMLNLSLFLGFILSIDYIDFLSPTTPLLPSLGTESLNALEANSK